MLRERLLHPQSLPECFTSETVCRKGQIVFQTKGTETKESTHDSLMVYGVRNGLLGIANVRSGNLFIHTIVRPGETVAVEEGLQAISLIPSVVSQTTIPSETLDPLTEHNWFAKSVVRRVTDLEEKGWLMKQHGRRTQRVAYALGEMSLSGEVSASQNVLSITTNLYRDKVAMGLTELEASGIIRQPKIGKIVIQNYPRLLQSTGVIGR